MTLFTRTVWTLAGAALVSSGALAQQIQNTNAYSAPENSVDVGVGVSSGNQSDRSRFGLFNGLRKHDTNGLFDFNYSGRDAANGRWLTIDGRNLGLDNREFGVDYRWLGDFRVKGFYSEITRHDPRTINTSLQGAGTTTPTVSLLATPGTGQDLNLELKRKGLGFEAQKMFFGNFQVEVSFKNEDKSGARLFGVGFPCGTVNGGGSYQAAGTCGAPNTQTALLMLPEPVNSTIRQFEAKLNYNGPQLKLSGGYYGSFYTNDNGSINPNIVGGTFGNLNGGTVAWGGPFTNYMRSPVALWPDNQAHQFYLGGNYALTSHTKVNFKASYTHATQNENFGSMGLSTTGIVPTGLTLAGPTRSSLGGEINTTRLQAGISSHPIHDLHLTGDVLYDHKENKTPVDYYNAQILNNTPTYVRWSNSAMSPTKFEAKGQAAYNLPWWHTLQLIGGLKYEHEDFGVWTPTDVAGGVGALRQKLDTTGYRLELRKTMSETFSGSLAWLSERRDGASPWLKPVPWQNGTGVIQASQDCQSVGTNACVYNRTSPIPFTVENMQRDKIRMRGDWSPYDRLNFQLQGDFGRDHFRGPTESGLSATTAYNLSLDADYQLADNWKLRAYWTGNRRTWNMGHSTDYELRMTDVSQTVGAGFVGQPLGNFKLGGDVIGMHDVLKYQLSPDQASTSAANNAQLAIGLPDVKYTLLRLNLYGEYVVNKTSSVRLDYIYDRTFFNEWTWQGAGGNSAFPFLFSDNTTIGAKVKQSVSWIGARYVYRFQ